MRTQGMAEPTAKKQPVPRPPRRGRSFKTFCTLDGITPEIVNDMHRCLRGDGYDRVNRTTRAFMTRHNLEWVHLYAADVELGR